MLVSFGSSEIHLRDYLYVLRKRKAVIVGFFILSVLLGVLVTQIQTVLYESRATILIERDNPNVVDFKEVMSLDASSTDYYRTQYLLLKSESLARDVIEETSLNQDAYFKRLQKGNLRALIKSQSFVPEIFLTFINEPSAEDIFLDKLLRVDPVRNSRLVNVSVRHPDPEQATYLANEITRMFIQKTLAGRFDIATQATEMITEQIADLKTKVTAAEQKLQEYKEANGLVVIPSIHEQDKFIQDAKLELVKLQAQESNLAKRYLPAHPKRIHLRSEIQSLSEKIQEEGQKNLKLSRIALDYDQLEREASSARQIYEALLGRLQETTSEAKTQASNITVVDRAVTPSRPVVPKPLLNLLGALFVGLGGGVLLAFFIEYFDSTIRIPDDVEKGLGLELLGIVPLANKDSRRPANGHLLFDTAHPSPVSESFRALRTAILFRFRRVSGCRVLLTTSPNPEEGKTTVSLNLAAAFHQNHLKVLLIDADLRKPKIHKIFDVEDARGLSDVLEGTARPRDVIAENVDGLGFDVLFSGPHSDHPTEILGSKQMSDMLTELKSHYDIIIIDSPPYLAVADVAVLNEYVDGITVVTRYHKTDKRHLKDMKKRLSREAEKILGIVINQVSVKEKDYYYQQYYYYGYGDAKPRKR